jgi:hypothetical protein
MSLIVAGKVGSLSARQPPCQAAKFMDPASVFLAPEFNFFPAPASKLCTAEP